MIRFFGRPPLYFSFLVCELVAVDGLHSGLYVHAWASVLVEALLGLRFSSDFLWVLFWGSPSVGFSVTFTDSVGSGNAPIDPSVDGRLSPSHVYR